ncbi:MAG: hypothetical protein OQK82_03615 [Candidatus Pacearchaeota archaeon]|nr:hypothetical protein [Candidatus Pacearchaeota archaeon]
MRNEKFDLYLIINPFIDKLSDYNYHVAKIIGFDGAYLRFSGTVTIKELEGDTVMRSTSEESAVLEKVKQGFWA